MRSVGLGAVVLALAGGVVGAALVRVLATPEGGTDAASADADGFARIERRLDRIEERLAAGVPPPTVQRTEPTASGGPRAGPDGTEQDRSTDLLAAMAALRTQLATMASVQDALARHAGLPPPWPTDAAEVERVRERWRAKLEASAEALWAEYPKGPDPRGDVVAWSRFDDHRRAKEAFEAATDAAALRALSEGEFRGYFTVAR